jgi:hypothetical protein
MRPGAAFECNGYTGTIISLDDCAAHVLVTMDGETAKLWWSTGAYVYPIDKCLLQQATSTDLVCPNCGRECSSTSGLTLHTKGCSPRTGDRALDCDICGHRCSSTSGLTLHKRGAHGIYKDAAAAAPAA